MGMKFKKGHIVPRWCHATTSDRKSQHHIKFGCDVEVVTSGGIAHIHQLTEGAVIHMGKPPRGFKRYGRRMKGGAIKYCSITADEQCVIHILPCKPLTWPELVESLIAYKGIKV